MADNKKNILIIMGRYLPGYKDGGPVRSIKNLVDYLGEEYNFKILTCDRDHGDTEPYKNIKVNDWNVVGNANVYYVPPKGFKLSLIKRLSKEVDLVYCCGCFNDYAINTLILKRFNIIKVPVVVAAMGLFSPMEFRLKYAKKKIFTTIFNLTGMFSKIYWSATSQMEIDEIKQQIKCKNNFFIAEDLPRKVDETPIIKEKEVGKLKVVWISRIAPKKNLKGAIQILQNVKSDIEFTIYGPIHVQEYWDECLIELNKLPDNIKWSWKGNVDSENVVEELKRHHVFLFPTLGENYGHVIQEALSAGCPVILSDQTPWDNLEYHRVGYSHSLNYTEGFINSINYYVKMNKNEFNDITNNALKYVCKNQNDKVKSNGYKNIFNTLS
ncbi:glycosyltransferase [Romboutsia sp. CE17]|uniref:glycosyltransferase family 4 protein n=1 Tax=Romboutsia sp. CE17 TaxID=2724150 RepID=UPI001442A95F|nr:glycosyltransferase [Romboutsia sp. CE17]QJA09397.1 glycosyltransferase [Romboutsia sp. CE17]